MAISSIHKRYVGLLDSYGRFNFCNALFQFKEFMKTTGWTVTKSGFSGSTSMMSSSSDVITSDILMNSEIVWFVLHSPLGKELLFYRSSLFNSKANSTGLYIAYSADSLFSATLGINNSAVSASNPPMANDAVWITSYSDIWGDLASDMLQFSAPPNIAPLPISELLYGDGISDSMVWYFHVIADTVSPFGFYFFISKYDIATSQISTSGLFCMDRVSQQTGDLDPYVFWNFPGGISGDEKQIFKHSKRIKAWYGKKVFTTRQKYMMSVTSNQSRFLPTAPLTFTSSVANDNFNLNYPVSSGVVSNLANQDQVHDLTVPAFGNIPVSASGTVYLLPVSYCKGNIYETTQLSLDSYTNMPVIYKGMSSTVKIPSKYFNELSTLNYTTANQYILIGSDARLAFKWDGTIIRIL